MQGHAYARFPRALNTGNATTIALAAAYEMPHVGLAEALELCLSSSTTNLGGSSGRLFAGTVATAPR